MNDYFTTQTYSCLPYHHAQDGLAQPCCPILEPQQPPPIVTSLPAHSQIQQVNMIPAVASHHLHAGILYDSLVDSCQQQQQQQSQHLTNSTGLNQHYSYINAQTVPSMSDNHVDVNQSKYF